jgi:hypothetical protein
MYLLLGSSDDACCVAVAVALRDRGHEALIVGNPFIGPGCLAWRLRDSGSRCELKIGRDRRIDEDAIGGVLVRPTSQVDPAGWPQADVAYVEAEARAALLGWLWSLRCPVVNRSSPKVWYLPRLHLTFWRPLLRRCGLPVPAMRVSNAAEDARAFGEAHGGAVYAPFTGAQRYDIVGAAAWDELAQLRQYAPVCVIEPYTVRWMACLVGGEVAWTDPTPPRVRALEPKLRRFAAAAGLEFVALTVAATKNRLAIVSVELHPLLETFREPGRRAIVGALVRLLTGETRPKRARRLDPPRIAFEPECGRGRARHDRDGGRS